ncbi:transglutaminase-like domain-containing protein [Agromyces marinus]|uniref:Cysteine protease n=1 Tax=Agromyces marinus TaxID=1389020 RepID=A0ABM8GYP5_9MICO|nr:transglutaminase-like domain-containing protein [Agromyces marinus]UIP58170.1 hypothetical protein DSM26151_10410 [Agromyces marinus]BDZ53596.1 cysteine protease [Agromyces marinus]
MSAAPAQGQPRTTRPFGAGSRPGAVRLRGSALGSAIVGTLLVMLVLATAMIPWWPIYESARFLVAATVAIVTGAAIALAGAIWRWPAWAVVGAVAAGYVVLGVPVAVPARAYAGVLPTAEGVIDLVLAASLSWKQLVTISVPVGSYQALLVPPFLLGLIASAAAVTIAVRTRHPALALLPPAALLITGIVLGVVHDEGAFTAGAAFLVASIAWLVRLAFARTRPEARIGSNSALAEVRRIIGAALVLAVALGGATAASLAMPAGPRDVVRAELRPPFDPRTQDSPLSGFRAAFAPEVADREMLGVTGLPNGVGLRIAVLDTYDGIVYSVGGSDRSAASGQFTRLPYRLDQSDEAGRPVALEVEVLGYRDVWVPGAGSLERIEFDEPRADALADEFAYNDVTGTAAVRSGLQAGDGYRASSVATVGGVDLTLLRPGGAILPESPEAPDELLRLLDAWTRSSDEPGARLAAVIEGFHREGYVSHGLEDETPSRSGHALDRIAELATANPMVGDGEQYAVAAALLAREIGFPARVVVGYLPRPEDDAGAARVLRSSDLQAWIEVQAADGAWIPVDPNPEVRPVPEREPDDPTVVSRPQSALPPPEDPTPLDDRSGEPDSGSQDPDRDDAWVAALIATLRIVGIVLAFLALLASPFAAILVAKARRRRLRRRAPTSVERIEGGWQEFADQAADHGYPIVPTATRAEQAAVVGGLAPAVLAAVVDRAVFGPDGPHPGDDDRVWESVDELRGRLDEPRSRRERLRARVSLASLGGYAGSRKGTGT